MSTEATQNFTDQMKPAAYEHVWRRTLDTVDALSPAKLFDDAYGIGANVVKGIKEHPLLTAAAGTAIVAGSLYLTRGKLAGLLGKAEGFSGAVNIGAGSLERFGIAVTAEERAAATMSRAAGAWRPGLAAAVNDFGGVEGRVAAMSNPALFTLDGFGGGLSSAESGARASTSFLNSLAAGNAGRASSVLERTGTATTAAERAAASNPEILKLTAWQRAAYLGAQESEVVTTADRWGASLIEETAVQTTNPMSMTGVSGWRYGPDRTYGLKDYTDGLSSKLFTEVTTAALKLPSA